MWQDIYGTAGAEGLNSMFQNFDFNFGGQFNSLPTAPSPLAAVTAPPPSAPAVNPLPLWAQQGTRQYIDPYNNAAFRPQDAGSGSATMGAGTGQGFYSGLGQDLFDTYSIGEGEMGQRINFDRLNQFLGDRRLVEIAGPNNQAVRFMEGADGSIQGPVDTIDYNDPNFRTAAALAMAVTGANIGAAAGGLGGGAATSGATNPALIESAVGTAGYGASSAGAGNAMSAAGLDALYNMQPGWMEAASPVLGTPAPTTSAPTMLDYGLNTAPNAQTGGVLGGTSNGVPGGIGEGLQALPGVGTELALPTGTGQGIGVMNPVTGTMGPTLSQVAGFAPEIGSTLPPVGQSMLPPSMQTPSAPVTPPTGSTPSTPPVGGAPGTGGAPGGRGGFDPSSMFASLLTAYQSEQNRKDYQELIGKLDGLYSPDSPYAQQMRDELERRDSAAGRASQYGPRSVELAAKLTDSRRQALGQMSVPLAAMMFNRNNVGNGLFEAATGSNGQGGNIIDAGQQVFEWGSNAWDWMNKTFPDIFGGRSGG